VNTRFYFCEDKEDNGKKFFSRKIKTGKKVKKIWFWTSVR